MRESEAVEGFIEGITDKSSGCYHHAIPTLHNRCLSCGDIGTDVALCLSNDNTVDHLDPDE